MQNAMVLEAPLSHCASGGSIHQQLPLTFLHAGEAARVIKVRGKGETKRHLENMGFVPGAPVKVITQQSGNLIVEIKGSQVALDRTSAQKIIAG